MLNVGDQAPAFTLQNEAGEDVTLAAFHGKPVILYWYPRDDTPGCTTEACGFRDAYREFAQAGAVVLGVSTDDVQSHAKFKGKYNLPFTLLSDPDHQVAQQYGVWGSKTFMGREREGIHRVTYLIDEHGLVKQVWPKVKPEGHADEILAVLQNR